MQKDIPHQTAKHCQDVELEMTESPRCKESVHCFKEKTNLKNPERRRWSAEEDETLTQMVKKHGLNNWQTIARAIPDRNALQCRMRWKCSLDPEINKEAWSEQEEVRLIRAHQVYGNKWLQMVKHFPGRTNYALKEHWRGPMKRKLDSYLASGLLEQVPDLDLSVPVSSRSDISKDSEGLSDKKLTSPALPTNPIPKQEFSEQGENADSSEGECSDVMDAKGIDVHSSKVSEKVMEKSKQRARARKKLDFLSTPVELKVCAAAATSQKPLTKMEQMNASTDIISPATICQDIPLNVPLECVKKALSTAANNHPSDVRASETPDPCSLELPEANAADLLDMSYCDGLMLDSPIFPHIGTFM